LRAERGKLYERAARYEERPQRSAAWRRVQNEGPLREVFLVPVLYRETGEKCSRAAWRMARNRGPPDRVPPAHF